MQRSCLEDSFLLTSKVSKLINLIYDNKAVIGQFEDVSENIYLVYIIDFETYYCTKGRVSDLFKYYTMLASNIQSLLLL